MSALTPQIKSHRAMAEALRETAGKTSDPMIAGLLGSMAAAHEIAVDALEAGEAALRAAQLDDKASTVHYDPKGKPPRSSER